MILHNTDVSKDHANPCTPPPQAKGNDGEAKQTEAEGGDGEKKDRIIYGNNVVNESDEIKYKWNAIFHK